MYKILLALYLTFSFASLVEAKSFSLSQDAVSFDAPAGFVTMSPELTQIKYPKGNAPKHALTNESTESSIVYALRDKNLPQDEIEATAKGFEEAYRRVVGGFKLISNKIVHISGQKWFQLEFLSNTIDSQVNNIFLVTGYKHKMVVFNFNATIKEFQNYEKDFRASIQSIKLN